MDGVGIFTYDTIPLASLQYEGNTVTIQPQGVVNLFLLYILNVFWVISILYNCIPANNITFLTSWLWQFPIFITAHLQTTSGCIPSFMDTFRINCAITPAVYTHYSPLPGKLIPVDDNLHYIIVGQGITLYTCRGD